MREIKFRVWTGNEMEYNITVGKFGVFYVNPENGNGLNPNDRASLTTCTTKYPDDIPLMQFTGLIDNNGKEIYEGDIIIQYPGFGCMFSPRKGVVNYRDASFWFDLATIAFILEDHDCSLEVIGNIYEHRNKTI